MGRKITIPESVADEWRRRLNEGQSIESIARAYGVNHGTVRKRLGIVAFEGRLGRAAEGREIHKHVIHMDVSTQAWVEAEAKRLNCTHGLYVEYCLELIRKVADHSPVTRDEIKHHLEEMLNKESANG